MTDYASTAGWEPALNAAAAADPAPAVARGRDEGVTRDRTLPSSDLLQGAKCVQIVHNGAVYRLQATRLGKLILTK